MDPRFKIGMRNIKTALSVGICILFFQLIGISDGIQAAFAAIICMKSSLQNSVQTGIERIIGTVIGAILGVLALLLNDSIPYQISTLVAIIGVVFIIYLCNVFKAQASTVISLVVFLIILIGEKNIPPVYYGIMRLIETVFGIIIAYLVNRFVDPRHLRKAAEDMAAIPEIRISNPEDLGQIMSIWLRSNISAHPHIDPLHWHNIYDDIRTKYKDTAKVFVYDSGKKIEGFVSLLDDTEIEGLYIDAAYQNKGIELLLLNYLQFEFPSLSAKVYSENKFSVDALTNIGFEITAETIDNTGAELYNLEWSRKVK